ncbi:protein kinase [Nostoc sp. FACHB-152]|uniref:serine/threonine protein kinase n=1 Tax=unclassified Nostoc TaxID=2593658 RepID=UPI001686E0C8|nr:MULTISPECIES: serine/threonine-protein kinase [unclassified Nostoc]MBD2449281.1 protein kinase [Nostoc sp. FACHB-152]MBD2470441.1 protein kinase [Nostoc sp. FACHB-145]
MNSQPSSNYWNGHYIGENQRYRIEKPLAAGGMGEVLLATDTRIGQQVVLKLLKDTLVASQEMRKRFEREVAVCAALQSDHIVRISDCGVTPEGYPFYVMEYLRGQTLRQLLLRERRLSVERTGKIISQVCQGLQMAHQGVTLQKDGGHEHIRVIHRDLKPDNIFLVPTDLGEWVKILDFGVAKIRNDSSEQTNITSTFIGTFRYAAPEQIQNKQNLDARADIYSLGIILYEMLSGADPFGFSTKGSNVSEASWVLAHAYEPPTPLRSQPGCEQLSSEIEAVVLKCLHKNPDNRFASVAELNLALQTAARLATASNATAQPEQNLAHPQPNFGQETVLRPLQPAQPESPVYNQNLNNETVPRPLQPAQPEPPVYNQALNNETVPRPLQPVQPELPEGTIFQLRPSASSAGNNDTVPRPLQPSEPDQPEGTIMQLRPSASPGGNNDTVPRPLQPSEPDKPEGTIMQLRPSASPGGNNDTVPRPLQPSEPDKPEGTIFQLRPSASPGGNNETVPRPLQPSEPDKPEGTIFQLRPSASSAGNNDTVPRPLQPPQPDQPEGTILQIRSSSKPESHQNSANWQNNNQPTSNPENTLYQQRPTDYQSINNTQDNTIFQPRTHKVVESKNAPIFGRNLWVGIAVVLAFFAGMLIFQLQSNQSSQDQPSVQDSSQN